MGLGTNARRAAGMAALVTLAVVPTAHAAAPTNTYIVQLKAAPIASYTGGTRGLRATSPLVTGQRKLNVRSASALAYRSFLAGRQDAALAHVRGAAPKVDYSYRVAFAGFSAELTHAQAATLRNAPEVARVFKDAKFKETAVNPNDATAVDTELQGPSGFGDTAAYLGLTKGLWATLGGPDDAGDGVIVGVIDSGINPDHPSFAGAGFTAPPAAPVWNGACAVGTDSKFKCNNKLIGARFYVDGFGQPNTAADSFISPRDDDGHGSHTASTAAGNFDVKPTIQKRTLGVTAISGLAPHARVAAYKVCWVGGPGAADGCANSDSVAAIDDAVADGVDVINYSVGGTTSDLIDPVSFAFLGASDAGVFVANSAGNDGPDPSTVGSPTTVPWLTSVGADMPARTFNGTATITPSSGSPFTITGASVTGPLAAATNVINAKDAAAAGVPVEDAERCFADSLDPAKVTGNVVLCLRGVNPRIEKSKVVAAAGGKGMILYNADPAQDLDNDIHYVPAVHVSNADGVKVRDAVAAGPTKATMSGGAAALGTPRVLAAFSSRGPQTAVPDIAKPDLVAPGVNILAGNTDNPAAATFLPDGQLFQSQSGTSMSGPQVAGAGALLKDAHPDWSAAMIKSALMLTANSGVKLEDGTTAAPPFDAGSGEIDPTAAASPGLVLDENTTDYVRYVDTQEPGIITPDPGNPLAPSDLNLASISNGKVAGTFTTTRTFTSVASTGRHWTAAMNVPGFDGSVSPSSFDIGPGATQALTISALGTTAPLDKYAFGQMTLTDGTVTLHLPVSLRPIAVSAPDTIKVTATQSQGSAPVAIRSGVNGPLSALAYGLAAPSTKSGETITTDPAGIPDPGAPSASMRFYDVDVPAGAQLLSGRIANADGDADPNTDLDLYLFRDANNDGTFSVPDELVDQSASAIADEGVTEALPEAGKYRFVVVGFTTRGPSTYDFSTWLLNDGAADNTAGGPGIAINGDPFNVGIGQTLNATLEYANVDHKGLYLGLATFHDSGSPTKDNMRASSVVELNKTGETTSASSSAGSTSKPTAKPASTRRTALRMTKVRARLRNGRLTLTFTLTRKAALSVKIRRAKKTVFSAKRRGVPAGRHTLRLRVGRKLRHGRRYAIRLTATVGKTHVRKTVNLRVPR
jgi:subtilisin family serine protease